jgi:hypothetical protein
MRFLIDHYERRHPLAYRGKYTRIDVRTTDDPRTVPAYNGKDDWWYAMGENHRIVDGRIVRDFPGTDAWFIDFPDLSAFAEFVRAYGYVEVRPVGDFNLCPEISLRLDDY